MTATPAPPPPTVLSGPPAPDIRLALAANSTKCGPNGAHTLSLGREFPEEERPSDTGGVVPQFRRETRPSILISFAYLKNYLIFQKQYAYRTWAMDSGAFSAYHSGMKVDIREYIETCKHLLANDPTLVEVMGLDVIGNWKASVKNFERMWEEGVPAIPIYHYGEPEHVMHYLKKVSPGKMAIGGAVGVTARVKLEQAKQIFARIWPMRIHGLGFGSKTAALSLPWHSTDSTNWEIGPCQYGRWASLAKVNIRGSSHDLRSEVEYYLTFERQARERWKKQMDMLERDFGRWPVRNMSEVTWKG